ncbi:hypothetical protein [Rhodococcus aetherivorans]|uniref:hypothetical protein n=1 Tax=Rhodococcus aetherivorans TaxID=191292 RepID=UPI0035A25F2E
MRIGSAAHGIAQHWARTIRAAHPDLDGLAYRRRFAGGLCVALFTPAAQAFLDHPETIPSSAVRPPCSCLCLDSCTPGKHTRPPGDTAGEGAASDLSTAHEGVVHCPAPSF